MARKRNPVDKFRDELETLNQNVSDNLRLPSLRDNRLQGFAYHFMMALPLLTSDGEPVFAGAILEQLFLVLDNRFGGCLVASSSSTPPFWGIWHPSAEDNAEKDYLTTAQVFANPIEPTNLFFTQLKEILKTAGHVEQQEILIARTDCWLL